MQKTDPFAAGVLHPKYKTPAVALVVQLVWTSVLCLSGTYNQMTAYNGILDVPEPLQLLHYEDWGSSATYPHMVAFPLAMELMTDTSFPFPVMGLVHIANRIEVVQPMSAGEPFDVRVWAADMSEHERGTQFQIRAEVTASDAVSWRSSSTYLHREKSSNKERSQSPNGAASLSGGHAVWEVPGDIGRRYAAVSGDRNPIHLHPLSAKLFGMKAPIAHGMWTKARCLASAALAR